MSSDVIVKLKGLHPTCGVGQNRTVCTHMYTFKARLTFSKNNVADKAHLATADNASQTSHMPVAAFLPSSALSMTCSKMQCKSTCCMLQNTVQNDMLSDEGTDLEHMQ